MADNKATALKEASKEYLLKVYYSGDTPAECGAVEIYQDILDGILDGKHTPWLIKFYEKNGLCHQYADTRGIYRRLSQDLGNIFDAIIVNTKQRAAIDKLIDKLLWGYLGQDMANENDSVLDPYEF